MSTAIVWFRRDLRLTDNAALEYALKNADRLLPVYIHAPDDDGDWAPGAASRWWLHHSLAALSDSLAQRGSRLVIHRGSAGRALKQLVRDTGAQHVCWNRLYEPSRLASDRLIEQQLRSQGCQVFTGTGHLLCEPWDIASQSGTPYRVYTPYSRVARTRILPTNITPVPRTIPAAKVTSSLMLNELGLLPTIRWDAGLEQRWEPGETGARKRLRSLEKIAPDYARLRDFPADNGTSGLSPHLHFGELSPRQFWLAIQNLKTETGSGILRGAETLERELIWREFAHHVLHHFPHTPELPLDPRFRQFPWRRSGTFLSAWQRGETGIPIVDAGMRELWATGFMHNRVRMITASFLTKHMGQHWIAGARWFWDTLVDADLANNTLNWQWVAGCGADAAPYFRIFNPVLQGGKFDAQGHYVRHWLPALASLPSRYVHAPHTAPATVLAAAGVKPGQNYPRPVLDLALERQLALARYQSVRGKLKSAS